MKKIEAKIVADSINSVTGDRVTTFLLTFPRFILSELNTHRMFSRNSASSRAIPFEEMVKMVEEDPFIPIAWQKDHSGMQGSEYFQPNETFISENPMDRFAKGISSEDSPAKVIVDRLKAEWLWGRDMAVQAAKNLHNMGVLYHPNGDTTKLTGDDRGLTKQLCNRLLEPFMWHTVLLTGTEFKNFFELRCPKYEIYAGPEDIEEFRCFGYSWKDLMKSNGELAGDFDTENVVERLQYNKGQAEIHMAALAEAMYDAYNESTPKELKAGEWHIPFGDKISDGELRDYFYNVENNPDPSFTAYQETKLKVSTARCARLSYMTFDGEIDYQKDMELHDRLLESKHMSPFEHCCKAMTSQEYYSFIKGQIPTIVDNYGITNLEMMPYSSGDPIVGFKGLNPNNGNKYGWCNNFRGWISYRYTLDNKYSKI